MKLYKDHIVTLANTRIINNTIGVARSFIALSALITIAFNDLDVIFSTKGFWFNFFNLLDFTDYSAKLLSILVLTLVLIGWRPRITAILHFWIAFSLFDKVLYPEGGDRIAAIITFLLIPVLLFDARKWHWNPNPDNQKEWSFFEQCVNIFNGFVYTTIRVQVCLIYFFSGISKPFLEDTWIEGTAIYYYFYSPTHGYTEWLSGIIVPLVDNAYILLALTWGTILLELVLAFCLVASRKYYKYFLIAGIALHFSIFLIQGLSTFFLVMTGALLIYLGPKEGYDFKMVKRNPLKILTKQ